MWPVISKSNTQEEKKLVPNVESVLWWNISTPIRDLASDTSWDVFVKLFWTKEVLLTMFPFLQTPIDPADLIKWIANARVMDTLKSWHADDYVELEKTWT